MKSNLKIKIKNTFLASKLKQEKKYLNINDINTAKPVVLIIDNLIPEFDKDSGSRRLFKLIQLMLKNNFFVVLMADLKEYKYKSDYIERFREKDVFVYEPYINESGKFISKEGFLKEIGHVVDFAWLHRPEIFNGYFNVIKNNCPKASVIFDMVDFHYLRLKREYEIDNNKDTLKAANDYFKIELDNCKKADKIVLISTGDEEALTKYDVDLSKAEILSNVHQHHKKDADFVSFEDRRDLLFIGGFKHAPNEDAVLYLHNYIMPKIWEKFPDMIVNIVGSYPTDAVLELDSELFKIHGFVDDVAPFFETAKAFIAPLRYGAGIKGKIGQSLEYSLPVITTDVGAEGFDFSPYNNIMIANNAETFAINVIKVLSDKTIFENLSNHAEHILAPFSLEQTEENLLKILSK